MAYPGSKKLYLSTSLIRPSVRVSPSVRRSVGPSSGERRPQVLPTVSPMFDIWCIDLSRRKRQYPVHSARPSLFMPPMASLLDFDLHAYVAKYTGYTQVRRLLYIASKDPGLADAAYEKAASLLRVDGGCNTSDYCKVVQLSKTLTLDEAWVTTENERAHLLQNNLESELEGYKRNLIKESIRMANNDLANFFVARGDLKSALSYFLKNRGNCTTRKHVLDNCLHIIKLSLNMENFALVQSQATRGHQVPSFEEDEGGRNERGKLDIALGLAYMSQKQYHVACASFLKVPASLGNAFSAVATVEDAIMYGTLCGLATCHRKNLKRLFIDNENTRKLMELVPLVRDMVTDFYTGDFSKSLATLDKLRTNFERDIYLGPHMNALYESIRNEALQQYFAAYLSVQLPLLAEALNCTVEDVTKRASTLIMKGKLQARIDSQQQILNARANNERRGMFAKAVSSGQSFLSEGHAILLRMNIAKHKFVHHARRRDDGNNQARYDQ